MSISPTPNTPATVVSNSNSTNIKPATPDLIDFDSSYVPVDYITSLIFETVGSQELIGIVRADLVNGKNLLYSPIKNLTSIASQYSPENIFTVPINARSEFANFAIKLENYFPEFGTGPNQETVYMDEATRNIVVNVINMRNNEQVEIEVLSRGEAVGNMDNWIIA